MVFVCSLVHNGLLGGTLYLDSEALTYKTNKVTVNPKYKNLVLPIKDIQEVTWNSIIATFHMKDNSEYKIMIFNKNKFIKEFKL